LSEMKMIQAKRRGFCAGVDPLKTLRRLAVVE
jgi:4-hydroxy-3-methylbut-2-enyl diphosphate reductase IspH